jgi:hypothetical protein
MVHLVDHFFHGGDQQGVDIGGVIECYSGGTSLTNLL